MKKRLAIGFVALVAAYFLFQEFKSIPIDWYANNIYVRATHLPSSENPDQIFLTWVDDPRTSQAVQWRTSPAVTDGWVQFREVASATEPREVEAARVAVEDALLENDPINHRFTARLLELNPGTQYAYRVGSRDRDVWSDWREFTTAPDGSPPFSFVYLGDPQVGLREWGNLLHRAYERHPEAAFYVIAGDLVNKGNWRDEWDTFFNGACNVFDRKTVIPSLGNHDYSKQDAPQLYLDSFALPLNGPPSLNAEHAYHFEYSNALFVVLDSNLDAEDQVEWLQNVLAASEATWKFAVYHHPAYSSAPHRDNHDVRDLWGPLFDKHGVDIALQGHDHAYLRTYPMRDGERVESTDHGVIYTVTVSGTKYYEQEDHDYAAVAFPNVSTYQIIDIETNPDRLTYTAYDWEGTVRDEFTIEK